MSHSTPLRLTLHPLLPTRTTGHNTWFEYGFQLRLPDGPLIDRSDPLLSAYGARVTTIAVHTDDDEQLQDDAFDPGSVVRLLTDVDDDGEAEVGVWDSEELHRAGSLLGKPAQIIEAAIDVGLEQTAIVLTEDREAEDDRRSSLDLFVFHPGFVEVDTEAARGFTRPERSKRPRLVLVADGKGDVRWWDPSVSTGPAAVDALPMSPDLRSAVQRLRAAYADLDDTRADARGFERFEMSIDRCALAEEAQDIWKRARAELGRRFAIGYLGAGMERPVWSPAELDDDADDDGLSF